MKVKINNRMKGTVEYKNLDERFNERKWTEGSDSRIRDRKRLRKRFKGVKRAYNAHFRPDLNAHQWTQLFGLAFLIFLTYCSLR